MRQKESNRGMEKGRKQEDLKTQGKKQNTSIDMDELQRQAEKERGVKKPGSQSNSSSTKGHNNGRGGGK
jgi:hypothetical protein